MDNNSQLKKMIDNIESDTMLTQRPETQMEAYLLAYRIQKSQKFFEYFRQSGASSPQTVVQKYIQSLNAPTISLLSALNVKEVLFENLNRNKHKKGMLRGVAQAYFDLCLFLGLSNLCTGQNTLNYAEAVKSVETSLDVLEKGYDTVCDRLSILKWSGDLEDFYHIAEHSISFAKLRKRFDQSVQIVYLYLNNRVKYDESYDSLISSLTEKMVENEDEVFFYNVLSVLSNKDQFTEDQIDHVRESYRNRFTEEDQEKHNKLVGSMNPEEIKAISPSPSDSKAYFFRGSNQSEGLFSIL